MDKSSIIRKVATRLSVCAALAAATLSATDVNARTHRALLIGIGQYTAGCPQACPLPGTGNDIAVMRELLADRFGFRPQDIQTLQDQQATRDAIMLAIRNLAQTAARDDVVYIHFSGHGSQVADANGDEEDGFDETILPYNARTSSVPDITDDELNALVGEFKAEHVVVVLDSCYSGTGTRSALGQVTPRAAPADTRTDLYKSLGSRGRVEISENHVLFTAAQDYQQELDGPFGPERERMGLLTASLSATLERAPQNVSPKAVLEEVDQRIDELKSRAGGYSIPEPNLEAPPEKHETPLFGYRTTASLQSSEVFTDSNVQEVTTLSRLLGYSTQSIQGVFVASTVSGQALDRQLASEVVRTLGQGFSVAQTSEEADVVVVATQASSFEPMTFDVYGQAAATLVANDVSGKELVRVVHNAVPVAALLSLRNPVAGDGFSIRVAGSSPVRSAETSTRAIKLTANSKNDSLTFHVPGMPRHPENSLQLQITTDRECYLTLTSIDSKGNVAALFPNFVQEERKFLPGGRITANESTMIPDSLQDPNLAGFHFDYAPPAGVDRLVGICTADKNDADILRSRIGQLEAAVQPKGVTNVTPGTSVGGPTAFRDSFGWVSAQLSLTVK